MEVHATVTLPGRSGQARDNVINSWAFSVSDIADPNDVWDELRDVLVDFYETTDDLVTTKIARYIGNAIDRSVKPMCRFYNIDAHLSGSPAGSPVAMREFPSALTGAASPTDLPSEVAVVLTMAADFGSDVEFGPGTRPRARDRARVFVGPLNITASETVLGIARPAAEFRTNLAEAGARMARHVGLVDHVVWSRRSANTKPSSNVWVDDAFDTQRRRGQRATTRTARAA